MNYGFKHAAGDLTVVVPNGGDIGNYNIGSDPVPAAEDPIKEVGVRILIAEGKTKKIYQYPGSTKLVIIKSKDNISAGNGVRHDVIEGKGVLATNTTCNVFRLLQSHNIPLAFKERIKDLEMSNRDDLFLAERCKMIALEVVVRRIALGSYCMRNPSVQKGACLPELIVEFFLKTTDKKWEGQDLPIDDPLMQYDESTGKVKLYLPNKPIEEQKPFLELEDFPLKGQPELKEKIELISKKVFTILEDEWKKQECELGDFKLEYGLTLDNELKLADVIDNCSWRLRKNGKHLDKQPYREGATLEKTKELYTLVSEMTSLFTTKLNQ
jgi:phosphoribosylaminoimidazole-succinocarboxamide synthase